MAKFKKKNKDFYVVNTWFKFEGKIQSDLKVHKESKTMMMQTTTAEPKTISPPIRRVRHVSLTIFSFHLTQYLQL